MYGKLTQPVPIARCGYFEYAKVTEVFEMKVPGLSEVIMAGLEGNMKKIQAITIAENGDDKVEKKD